MKKTVGILAHVDAGKTTFSERVLYTANAIRTLGRVDHQSAFLDAHPLEKQRGITIFSGMAQLQLDGDDIIWLAQDGRFSSHDATVILSPGMTLEYALEHDPYL